MCGRVEQAGRDGALGDVEELLKQATEELERVRAALDTEPIVLQMERFVMPGGTCRELLLAVGIFTAIADEIAAGQIARTRQIDRQRHVGLAVVGTRRA